MNYVDKWEEFIRIFLSQNMELFFLAMGLLFFIASWFNWDWVFDPPYNSIKNPIGFFFGRTAMRIQFFVSSIILIFLSLCLLYIKYFNS